MLSLASPTDASSANVHHRRASSVTPSQSPTTPLLSVHNPDVVAAGHHHSSHQSHSSVSRKACLEQHAEHEAAERRRNTDASELGRPRQWIVLALACFLLFGNYYCYDLPGAMNVQFKEYLGHSDELWNIELNALYTSYSFPNLIMPVVGGMLVDMLGPSKMLLIFSLFVCGGMGLFSIGVASKTYWMMALGRAFFGLGGESLEVAQARITTEWFRNRYLSLALGLNLTCARLATAINDVFSPWLDAHAGPVAVSWFGFATCVFSLLSGLLLSSFTDTKKTSHQALDYDLINSPLLPKAFPLSLQSDDQPSSPSSLMPNDMQDDSVDEIVQWVDIRQLPMTFWMLCLATITLYGAVNPFIHILSDFLQHKWHVDRQYAGVLMSIPDVISAVGSPVCGLLSDYLQSSKSAHANMYRYSLLPVSGLILMVVHAIMGFTDWNPIGPLILLGLAYSFFGAALWPMIPHLVSKPSLLGTAYGLSAVALNIALTFVPLIVGNILNYRGYVMVEAWFVGLSFVGALFGVAVGVLDYKYRRRQSSLTFFHILQQSNSSNDRFEEADESDLLHTLTDEFSRGKHRHHQPLSDYVATPDASHSFHRANVDIEWLDLHVDVAGDHHVVISARKHRRLSRYTRTILDQRERSKSEHDAITHSPAHLP